MLDKLPFKLVFHERIAFGLTPSVFDELIRVKVPPFQECALGFIVDLSAMDCCGEISRDDDETAIKRDSWDMCQGSRMRGGHDVCVQVESRGYQPCPNTISHCREAEAHDEGFQTQTAGTWTCAKQTRPTVCDPPVTIPGWSASIPKIFGFQFGF